MEPLFELNIVKPSSGEGTLVDHFSRQLKNAIVAQRIKSDSRLPSTRAFSRNFQIARNSAIAIYETLACEGYVQSKPGGGTFVSYRPPNEKKEPTANTVDLSGRLNHYWRNHQHQTVLPKQPNATFDFRIGFPCLDYFPFDTWRKLLAKTARRQATTLNFEANSQGNQGLREAIANHLSVSRAIACEYHDMVVTSGAQQALDLLARILVTPGKTKVAMDTIGYPMARCVFEAAGAIVVSVDIDEQGMQVANIPEEVSVVYVTPSHQFPYGMALSASRRSALLALSKNRGMSVIEDDYDSEFRLNSRPVDALKTLDSDHGVFYVGTFSKCMLPDIRIGFVLVPEWAKQALIKAKFQTDWFSPGLIQASLAEFISHGHLAKHLRRMRRIYSKRYETLMAACETYGQGLFAPIPINAGVHMTAMVNEPYSGLKASTRLEQNCVTIKSLAHFCQSDASDPPNGLVFGFGGIDSSKIEEGVKQVAAALKLT